MTRIISGTYAGRRLAVPARGTRPTADRVREAMFSTIESLLQADGYTWADLVVLDCFAGSGALGLEALSRGALRVVLVERDRRALGIIRRNVSEVGNRGAEVVQADAFAAGERNAITGAFGLVLADPPYDTDPARIAQWLVRLIDAHLIAAPGLVVIEGPRRWAASPLPEAIEEVRQRHYGDTSLWYGRAT